MLIFGLLAGYPGPGGGGPEVPVVDNGPVFSMTLRVADQSEMVVLTAPLAITIRAK